MATPAGRLPPGNQTGGTERQGGPVTAGAASLPAMETAKDDKARRDLGRLAARVDRLEGDNFRLVSLIAAGVVLLGWLVLLSAGGAGLMALSSPAATDPMWGRASLCTPRERYSPSCCSPARRDATSGSRTAATTCPSELPDATCASEQPDATRQRIRPTMPVS